MASETQDASRTRTLAFLALIIGALGIAFAPILAKLAVELDGGMTHAERLSPVAVAFWRMVLAVPVFGAALLRPGKPRQALQFHPMLMIPGLVFAIDLGVWHWSFEFTSVANSTLEANLAVVFVALAGWLWLKERFTWVFPVGAALALCGMAVLVGPNFSNAGHSDAWIGDVMGLSVALAYTSYQLSTKVLLRRYAVPILMTVTSFVSAVFLAIGAGLSPGRFLPETLGGWSAVVGLCLVSQVMGQGLIAYGLNRLPVALTSVVLVLQPVAAALLGWLILGQALMPTQLAGGAMVLAGIYLARRGSRAS